MPLYLPDGDIVAPEYVDLDAKLKKGDGIHWAGDPRLWIQIGVLTDKVTRREGRRIEVWRYNEDGSNAMIGHWLPSEQHRIIFDIARMRVDSPRHQDVTEAIDQANKAQEAKLSQASVESMYETLDHAIRLHHDRNNPRNKFFMNGAGNRGGRA